MTARSSPAVLLGAPLLLLAACGDSPAPAEPTEVLDLLVRRPDTVFEQVGEIVPVEGSEWGAYGGPGWAKEIARTEDGTPFVDTNQPRATLRLPAGEPAARDLAITLWCRARSPNGPGSVAVALNGVELASAPLESTPTELALATPAELWRLGDNVLSFETPRGDAGWDTVSVSRVAYGARRLVALEPRERRVEMPPETGLRYLIEAADEARVEIVAETPGTGVLIVRLGAMDPRTGAIEQEGFPSFELPVAGSLSWETALPPEPGRVRALDLVWECERDEPLALRRLEVIEQGGRARPTIVFVSIDTWSARHLSVYGYGRATTPNLERLARDGVVFERCIANAPWTMPSYLSVMTGLYPRAHRTTLEHAAGLQLGEEDRWQVADSRWTLAETLRARGYQTAASVDTLWLSPRFRVHQGFDLYDLEAAHYPFEDPRMGIAFILARVETWLDELRDPAAPAFLFLHALDSHGPYWPEPPYLDAFRNDLPDDLRPTPAGSAHRTFGAIPLWMARTLVPDADTPIPPELPIEEIIAHYDETILKVDDYIGRLCDLLRERGLYDDAVIVVSADHGESFRHGVYSHGNLWEDIVHVPLLLKLPRGEHGGLRVQESVQLVDVYPTLAELAGVQGQRDYLHGRSLLPLIAGEGDGARPTYSEGGHIEQFMIESGGWKLVEMWPGLSDGVDLLSHPRVPEEWKAENFPELVGAVLTEELWQEVRARPDFRRKFDELKQLVRGPYYELYDLRSDPAEDHDLAAERPDVVRRLLPLLERQKSRAEDAREDAHPEVTPRPFSAAELERLDELGY